MEKVEFNGALAGKEGTYELISYDETDRGDLIAAWEAYRVESEKCVKLGYRRPNLPEAVTETVFCMANKALRVMKGKGQSSACDCYLPTTDERIEVKSTSMVKGDVTSFSPRTNSECVYFQDFSTMDGNYSVYRISYDLINAVEVNKKQKFTDQQGQARRPRFSVKSKIINKYNLTPIYTGSVYNKKLITVLPKQRKSLVQSVFGSAFARTAKAKTEENK